MSAECGPYARSGGLGEVVAGLAGYQARAGRRVVVVMPLFPSVREQAGELGLLAPPQPVKLGESTREVRYFREARPRSPVQFIFVDSPDEFDRRWMYGEPGGEYSDNHRRFALFCRAALLAVCRFIPSPVVLHAHDWHAGLVPVFLRTDREFTGCCATSPVVFSIHNAGFQGRFAREATREIGLDGDPARGDGLEAYGQLNLLKGGLSYCDVAVTVSPTHAEELRTVTGGFGLHETFIGLGPRLVGIRSGVDQAIWEPASDPHLPARYSASHLNGKAVCKSALQRAYGLPERPRVPLFGMSARLAAQKGFDIVLRSHAIRTRDAQFAFLGMGEPRYQHALAALARERPQAVGVEFDFTDEREHRLLAGIDALLMPSLYEPCGLTQMRAQRYGALVVARRVGGLRETVEDDATGFLFDEFDADAFDRAIDRALDRFADPAAWQAMMRRAMARDFGWEHVLERYTDVYRYAEDVAAQTR